MLRKVITLSCLLGLPGIAAAADEGTWPPIGPALKRAAGKAPWVTVTPEVMPAGTVIPVITFDVEMPVPIPRGAAVEIEIPYHFGLPQTKNADDDNYFGADFPAGITMDLAVGADDSRWYTLRATATSEMIAAGTKFQLFLKRERTHPFDHAEVAFGTFIKTPPDENGDRLTAVGGQSTVVRIPGGPAAQLRVVAPTCVTPGETFTVKLAALDKNNNPPGTPWKGEVNFVLNGVTGPKKAKMKGPYLEARGFRAPEPGVYRIGVMGGLVGRSNPIVCREKWDRRIFWGDEQGHSAFSDGMRQPDEFFDYGRYVALLDVTLLTDHAECLYQKEWPTFISVANAKNKPPAFVTLLSYEWTSDAWSGGYGHRCIFFRGNRGKYYSSRAEGTRKPSELFAKYRAGEVVAIPHHSLAGARWGSLEPAFDRDVEIVSHWGCSEYEGNPFWKQRMWRGGGVVDALNSYYLLGFVGGGDNHNGAPGQNHAPSRFRHLWYTGGITAFLTRENTRAAVFDALYNRQVYATSGNRDFIDFRVAGAPMASVIPVAGAPTLDVEVATEGKIKSVEVVRGGETVYRAAAAAGTDYAKFSWRDDDYDGTASYYYLRVTSEDGHLAFATPVWVSAGEWCDIPGDGVKLTAGEELELPTPPGGDAERAVRVSLKSAGKGRLEVVAGDDVLAAAEAKGAGEVTIPFEAADGNGNCRLRYEGKGAVELSAAAVFAYPWLKPRWRGRWWTFEAEDAGENHLGVVTKDALASGGRALRVSPADNVYEKTVLWGPYKVFERGDYRAHFYLRFEGGGAAKPVAEIEVAAKAAGTKDAPRAIATKVLGAAGGNGDGYRDFALDFNLSDKAVCEFRVKFIGNAVLYIDKVDAQQVAYE